MRQLRLKLLEFCFRPSAHSDQDSSPEWLLLRNARRQEWGLAKGHAEAGESAEQCARREVAEETGIACLQLLPFHYAMQYTLPDGRDKEVVYLLGLSHQRHLRLSKEHDAYTWQATAAAQQHLPFDNLKGSYKMPLTL